MKVAVLVAQLDRDVEAIVVGLPSALLHLEEWTGEYPGSASGAPPAPAAGVSREVRDEEAELSRFEALAWSGDPALRYRLALLGSLRQAAGTARMLLARVDGVEVPVSSCDSEDLAVLRWAVKRLRVDGDLVGAHGVDRLGREVVKVRGLVDAWQPPAAKRPSGCRLHRAAGDHAEVHDQFRAAGLCRRCGLFRQMHGADPTPAILRAWSKGQKPTAGQIADAVTASKKKRRRRRRRRRAA